MTDQHPITPPPELVRQWVEEAATAPVTEQLTTPRYIATQAARWGADMELEACCEWVSSDCDLYRSTQPKRLRAARRPKPPSLKEQALAIVENLGICDRVSPKDEEILRRAIKSLPS